jgi:hypothetical protein
MLVHPRAFIKEYLAPAIKLYGRNRTVKHLAVHAMTQVDVLAAVVALWEAQRPKITRKEERDFREKLGVRETVLSTHSRCARLPQTWSPRSNERGGTDAGSTTRTSKEDQLALHLWIWAAHQASARFGFGLGRWITKGSLRDSECCHAGMGTRAY